MPEAAPVTVTLNWHWLLVLIVVPESVMVFVPLMVRLLVPPQTLLVPLTTVSPAGKLSVKATPVSATVFAAGFVIVNCKLVVAFKAICEGLNDLAIDGGATTLRVAVLLVVPVPPSFELIVPVVFAASPAAVPCTSTPTVH